MGFVVARYRGNGSLDSSFSGNGKVNLTSEVEFGSGRAVVAIGSDDGVVVAGGDLYGNHLSIAKFRRNGKLDRSFSGDGKFDDPGIPGATAVAVDEQGRIVVVGDSNERAGTRIQVTRLLADGEIDPAFGKEGHVTASAPGGYAISAGLAIDSHARPVVAGTVYKKSRRVKAIVARYETDGDLDPSFGPGGLLTAGFGDGDSTISGLTLARGKILIAGKKESSISHFQALLARVKGDGTVDRSFGKGGSVTSGFRGNDAGAKAIATDSHDRIVLAGGAHIRPGSSGNDHLILRYRRSGKLDRSFSGDGKRTVNAGKKDRAEAVAIDDKDRIVTAGTKKDQRRYYYQSHFAVLRLLG